DEAAPAGQKIVYVFDLTGEIGPAAWRITAQNMDRAAELNAEVIIIHLNTYGGLLEAADSISKKILHCPIPVYVFVDHNAISAGALIAISADKIYMRPGGRIGAATVVNPTGEPFADKFQASMRKMMHSVSEAHGQDTIVTGSDTTYRWRRDPLIAEAMVGSTSTITGVVDSSRVLALTTEEAIRLRYCEGKAEKIDDILAANHLTDRRIVYHTLTAVEKIVQFLLNPFLQSVLIMLIIGGIYFEMQTPGIGFAAAVSICAGLLYFAPLYVEGIANHWELALFFVGLILVGIEIFALPGFGIAGVAGIVLMILGISLAMVDNIVFRWDLSLGLKAAFKAACMVIVSASVALGLSIWLSGCFFDHRVLKRITLQAEQKSSEGYVSFDDLSGLTGATGTARTVLRPSGKIDVGGRLYDASSEIGYINPGEQVKIIRYETGRLYVVKSNT
ncbi:MAG: nodulation protein NfeD, partial [Bacteroidales bacterium]|nr:nodulation protein NfeD [Bacteroidales bacterium]